MKGKKVENLIERLEDWLEKHPKLEDVYYQIVYRTPSDIREFFNSIKWFFQRGKRGYAESDIWGFDTYLSEVLSKGLKDLHDVVHGHPADTTFKKWKSELRTTAKTFKDYNEFEYKDYGDNFAKSKRDNARLQKRMDKAFDFLKKYWGCLWD